MIVDKKTYNVLHVKFLRKDLIELNGYNDLNIKYILSPIIINRNKIDYLIKDKISLRQRLKHEIDINILKVILNQIIEIINILYEYNFSVHKLVVDLNYIYIKDDELYFIYLPINNKGDSSNINLLFDKILTSVKMRTKEDNKLLMDIIYFIKNLEDLNLDSIKIFLNNITKKDINFENKNFSYSTYNINDINKYESSYKNNKIVDTKNSETQILGYYDTETTFLNLNLTLHIKRLNNNEEIIIDKSNFIIGKDSRSCDYCIDNKVISRKHAKIIIMNNEFFIMDLNSTNHTYINNKILESNLIYPIKLYDRLILANEIFVVVDIINEI